MAPPGNPEAREPNHSPAPWLDSKPAPRWRRRLFKTLHVFGALLLLIYIFIMGCLMVILELPKAPVRMLMKLGTQGFGMIVEHAYALPICKLHVTFSRLVQRAWNRRPFHTRFVDIRTEIPLAGGGVCFIHAVPCMTDNFSYVIVDASSLLQEGPDRPPLPTCAVDPCDALAVVEALEVIAERYYAEAGGLCLEAVLCTHRHWDHAGGNNDLIQIAASEARKEDELFAALSARNTSPARGSAQVSRSASLSDQSTAPLTTHGQEQAQRPPQRLVRFQHPLKVYGGATEGTPGCTHKLWHGNSLQVGTLVLEALASPGHTKGSMMFRLVNGRPRVAPSVTQHLATQEPASSSSSRDPATPDVGPDVLFTGDTLFSGGCGAQFEGCELDIEHCFATVLEKCDSEDALLFPGHEYTFMLLEHRLTDSLDEWAGVEAPGQFLALCGAYYVAAHRRSLRDKVPTVPFMLKSERLINPHFDRSLLRHADVVVAMLDAQTGVRSLGDRRAPATPPVAIAAPPALAPCEEPPPPPPVRPLTPEKDDVQQPSEAAASPPAPERPKSPEFKPLQQHEVVAPSGEYVTGAAAPAYQFAFLYKQDLDQLRQDLFQDRLTGPEAAMRLTELEQRLFKLPLLTGGNDSFNGDGVEPWEEENALHEESKMPPPGVPAMLPPPAQQQEQEPEEPEEPSEEASWDSRWPSEAQVTTALKVLGVLAEVTVGPKAPCRDQDLPVSLHRLQRVLRRLNVSEEHMSALQSVLQKDEVGANEATSVQCSWCTTEEASRQMQAMNAPEGNEILPLRQVMQLLRPTPLQEHGTFQTCVRGMVRFCRDAWRDCVETLQPPAPPPEEAPPPQAVPLVVAVPREPSQEQPPEPPGPNIQEMQANWVARHRRAVERIFTTHALDKCPLCSCAFQSRPARARRRTAAGLHAQD